MNRNILCVDDEDIVLRLYKRLFSEKGLAVDIATDGNEGIKLFKSKDYLMAIIDFYMPGIQGDEIIKQMKAAKPDMPIILASGFPDEYRKNLADGFLYKPFTRNDLDLAADDILAEVITFGAQ